MGSLYKGLSAGLLRQATYTTARLGIYNNMFEAAKTYNEGKVNLAGSSAPATHPPPQKNVCSAHARHTPPPPPPPDPPSAVLQPLPLWQKAACGLTAGGLGALVGSPADLTLIRMQADTTLPLDQRRNYKGVGDALARIVKEEGAGGLFTGAGPTVVRAMALNMGMLASNDQVRARARVRGSGWGHADRDSAAVRAARVAGVAPARGPGLKLPATLAPCVPALCPPAPHPPDRHLAAALGAGQGDAGGPGLPKGRQLCGPGRRHHRWLLCGRVQARAPAAAAARGAARGVWERPASRQPRSSSPLVGAQPAV